MKAEQCHALWELCSQCPGIACTNKKNNQDGWWRHEWINVDDRLPELGEVVMVLTDYGKRDICRRLPRDDNKKWSWYNDMRTQHTNGSVVYWMALPKLDI